jgi:ribosomal protein S18 acetylase RimI-like enzyme
VTESAVPGLQVVDLCAVTAADLEEFWQREVHWWREQLGWDVSDALAALRRVVQRGGVPGKAVQVGARTVGYTYYTVARRLGVIAGLHVLPEWSNPTVGSLLLQETLTAIRQQDVVRIESPCLTMDCPWLSPAFAQQGFQTYWREFLRIALHPGPAPALPCRMVHLEPWQSLHAREAAAIMQAAYAGSVDAEINTLYRSVEGCQLVLDNILYQGGCGRLVAEASVLARHHGQGIGCIMVTEIAPHQSHVVQVTVLPTYQRQGVGRMLLHYSMLRLAALQYGALSLIVSRANDRARKIYQALGMHTVLAFPVFVWEQSASNS